MIMKLTGITRRQAAGSMVAALGAMALPAWAAEAALLNVSYDLSREFYKAYNALFTAHWQQSTGETLRVHQSHGASSKQARSVADGLEADVITMSQANDIDLLHERGQLIPTQWADRLPHHSAPTTSVNVILVRKGNPKAIHGWSDLARPGVSVIIPNPKTSGNGRYAYLAAWGAGLKAGLSADGAKSLVTRIFANVPVFDAGGRAATTTFAQRKIGDALVTYESELLLIQREFGHGFEVIYPSCTILVENPVSVVDKVVDKRGTRKQAEAYLQYLYSEQAQELAAQHRLRPRHETVLARHAKAFPKVQTFTVTEMFGGWAKAQRDHFMDGATYDQVILAAKAR